MVRVSNIASLLECLFFTHETAFTFHKVYTQKKQSSHLDLPKLCRCNLEMFVKTIASWQPSDVMTNSLTHPFLLESYFF